MPLRPTGEQIKELVGSDLDGPVVMLNLLKFAERATSDAGTGSDAAPASSRTAATATRCRDHLERVGAKVLWRGRVDSVVIGEEADRWDSVILVEYPSRKAFIEMTSTESYGETSSTATPALDDTRLIAMTRAVPRAGRKGVATMGRKILFITTDQQRYDSLGCNGGTVARTPVVDALARDGHQLPARVQPEHRVHAGALDDAHRPVRAHARRRRERRPAAGRRAERRRVPARAGGLPHRAARQGALRARLRPRRRSGPRTAWRATGSTGPYRGFEHAELAMHVPTSASARCSTTASGSSTTTARGVRRGFSPLLAARTGRRRHRRARDDASTRSRASGTTPTGSPTARSRTSTRCPTTPTGSCGCRFPDPHHPWDPPAVGAAPRATGATSTCRPATRAASRRSSEILAQKPAHWLAYYEGTFVNAEGGPGTFRAAAMTRRQLREINAMTHIMNELIDEACGRVLQARRGAGLGRRHRRVLHDRPRRAAGRLRPALQGPVPHRRADAAPDGLAAGAVGAASRPPT